MRSIFFLRGLCFPAISKARWDNRKAPQASRESRPHCKRVRSFHGTTILKLIIGLKLACFESIVQSKRLSLRQNCIVINTTDFKSIRRNFTAFELTFVKALPLFSGKAGLVLIIMAAWTQDTACERGSFSYFPPRFSRAPLSSGVTSYTTRYMPRGANAT